MKPDIHPKLNPVVFVDTSNGVEFTTMSTLTSDKTKKIKGVEHFVINIDVSSASHPFYTGEKMLVDTAGRVDKFRARQEAAEKMKAASEKTSKKKEIEAKETVEEKITRKAKENTEAKRAAKEEAAAKKKEATAKRRAAAQKADKEEKVESTESDVETQDLESKEEEVEKGE
ncbi:type B 50S ribosomal protein L31 [Candidatus Peregrinibacteria bacterium]|nr:type B 50S ribosomal protein L31 [Candidatus Peregrinibacteria bacterium]